jgi:uncharacterized protein YacL
MSNEEASLGQYWLGAFLLTVSISYFAISLWLGYPVFSLIIIWVFSFISAVAFHLAYSIVRRMFHQAKYLILLSGASFGIVISILIFIFPTQLGTSDYINYLKTILPSIISMLIGIFSGALLAPLFE